MKVDLYAREKIDHSRKKAKRERCVRKLLQSNRQQIMVTWAKILVGETERSAHIWNVLYRLS